MRTHHPGLIERGQRTGALSIGEYIGDIGDFTKPDPAIFCLDFVSCVLLTDILIYAADQSASFSLKQLLCILVGGLFLFRSSVFIHETVHAGKQIPFFGSLFNLLFGFVHKLPLYVMYPHKFHHTTETYGTIADPEYELLKGRPVDFVIPIFTQIISPLLLLMRFGFFPIFLPFLGKARRDTVYQYASTFVLNLKYVRARPDPSERREWYRQDAACVAYNCVFFALMATGIWPWKLFFIWYGVMYVSFVANFYRSMASTVIPPIWSLPAASCKYLIPPPLATHG